MTVHPLLAPLVLLLHVRIGRAKSLARSSERGASAVEWVVIAAILVAICVAVGLVIRNALTGKAGEIQGDIEGA